MQAAVTTDWPHKPQSRKAQLWLVYFIFPSYLGLTSASALPGKIGNPEMASFHFHFACFYHNTRNTLKYHLVTAERPFTVKTINWVYQTGPRKHSISCCLLPTRCMFIKSACHGVSRCIKDGSCSSSSLESSVILVILRYILWLAENQLQTTPTSGLAGQPPLRPLTLNADWFQWPHGHAHG